MINPLPGGSGKLPGPGIQAHEKRKMWVMGILFVIVLACFLGALVFQTGPGDAKEGAEGATGTSGAGPGGILQPVPDSRVQRRDKVELKLRKVLDEMKGAGILKDDGDVAPQKVLDYLLNEAIYDSELTQIGQFDYRKLPADKVLYEPTDYRGRLTSAFGKILAVPDEILYSGEVKEVTRLYPVQFQAGDGTLYRALSTTKIEERVGTWIQVYGIFFRLKKVQVEKKPESEICLLLTKKVTLANPPITVTHIDPDWEKQIHEDSFDRSNRLEERPFWLLLNFVQNLGIEGYRKEKAEGKIQIEDYSDNARRLALSPKAHRFHYVRLTGRVVQTYRDYLQDDNPGKITMVASGQLVQPSGYFVRLVAPRPWSDYGFRPEDDFVNIEGIFYRSWMYQPQGNNKAYVIPLVVVTDVTPIQSSAGPTWLKWVFLAAAGLILVVFLAFALRDRRARQEFRERVLEKKRLREMKPPGGGE